MSLSDAPLVFTDAEHDWLDRGTCVRALRRLLARPNLDTPLVLGIYGAWGTGKTSVMRTLIDELEAPERLMLWFDAWVYARQEQELWRALLIRVVETLRRQTMTAEDRKLVGDEFAAAARAYQSLWLATADAERARPGLDELTDDQVGQLLTLSTITDG
jgi:hypothetical protein